MTSSDVLDTCFNLQLKQSGKILLDDIDILLNSIKRQALKHKFTYVSVEVMEFMLNQLLFGLKMLTFYQEFLRNKKRLISLQLMKFQLVLFLERLAHLLILIQR